MLRASRFFTALFATTFVSLTVVAQTPRSIKELSKNTTTMPPIVDCASKGICDLTGAKLVERKVKVLLADTRAEFASYMTESHFVVEVRDPASIPKFGIIQFMKGCMFESELLPDGSVTKDFTYVHKHFGQWSLIHYNDWIIDSEDADPLATSFENYGRFDLYKWNIDEKNLDAEKATWYFDAKPSHGTVFKADMISNAGLIEDAKTPNARNSSLDMEVCIFRIDDVPVTSDASGTGVDKSKAIWCAAWDHKFVYDFTAGKVIQEKSINPFCATPSTGPL